MSQEYVPGPVEVWLGVTANAAPMFLGWTNDGVDLEFRPRWGEHKTDLSGGPEGPPADKYYAGQDAIVSGVFSRINLNCYYAAADKSVGVFGLSVPGIDDPGDRGALMVAEGRSYQLWLKHPHATKPFYAQGPDGALVLGYHFMAAVMDRESLPKLGPRPKRLSLAWHCISTIDMTFTNEFGVGRHTLFDHDMSQLVAPT